MALNPPALFLDLSLLGCHLLMRQSRYAKTYRACFTHHWQRIEHRRLWLLSGIRPPIIVLDADDNRKRYAGGNAHLG